MYKEKLDDAMKPDEMRRAIFKYSMYDRITMGVFRHSDHNGLSGEDRYAMLAYHALREADILREHLINAEMLINTQKPIVIKKPLDPKAKGLDE